jgi:hypothetical protein
VNKQDTRYVKFQGILKGLRKEQGIRQQELTDRLGPPQSYSGLSCFF